MDFIVKFRTDHRGSLVTEDLSAPGLDIVDDVRENLGHNIPLDQLNISCPYYGSEREFILSEELVRAIPFFKGNTTMQVAVPDGYLGRYLMYKSKFNYSNCSKWEWISKLMMRYKGRPAKGVVIEVKTVIDEKQVIIDWIADGHPTEWGFPKD